MNINRLLNYLIGVHLCAIVLTISACGTARHAEQPQPEPQTLTFLNYGYSGPDVPPVVPPPLEASTDCGTLVGKGTVVILTDEGLHRIDIVCAYTPKTTI